MKIIQIVPQYVLAGAEIMCENLIYALGRLGHEVIAVSLYEHHSEITQRLENTGVDVRYLNKKSGLDLSVIGKLTRLLKAEKPGVVHTHLYVAKYAVPAAAFAGIKVRVHTVHNIAKNESGTLDRSLNKFFFKCCNVIPVALSNLIQETIESEYKIKKEKIPVVLNGIDLSKCVPKDNYSASRQFRILHIGRFSEQKNHITLLEAFLKFHAKHPDSVLRLIGDGGKKAEAEAFVAAHGLENAVEFLGLQKNVHAFLHNADMFVLPSLYEGIPITLIEAMGSGVPIVASAVGGIPDMLRNNESALLIEPNAGAIADAFMRMAASEDLRKKLGKSARSAASKYSAEHMAKGYCKIYDEYKSYLAKSSR